MFGEGENGGAGGGAAVPAVGRATLAAQRDKGSVEKARARLRVRVVCGLADAALQERG